MPGIIAVLNAEIQKYQKLVTHLIASRDAILAAEGKSAASANGSGKKRGRPAKKAAAAPNGSGKKRGRPRKVAAAESKAE